MIEAYYQDDYCTIYHGDCRDILPHLDPVDLVLTDPPWLASKNLRRTEIKGGVGKYYKNGSGIRYGDVGEFEQSLIHDAIGTGNRAAVFTGLKEIRNFDWKWIAFWHRGNPMPTPILPYNQSVSPILMFGNWQGVSIGDQLLSINILSAGCIASPERVLEHKNGPAAHPCQMPVSLPTLFINATDATTVLDPWVGSGTTLVAAKDLQRQAIGIEIEEKYCEIAAERLASFEPLPFLPVEPAPAPAECLELFTDD